MSLSTVLKKEGNPLRLLYQKLFSGEISGSQGGTAKTALTLADVSAMPRQTQLLIGHFLLRGNPEMMLLDDDTDVCELLTAGWLTSLPASPPGFVSFKFKPDCWRQLKSLVPRFPNDQLSSELVNYRHRKTMSYPWVW